MSSRNITEVTMKTLLSYILLLALFSSTYAYSKGVETFTGYQEFKGRTFESISVNGSADFKNTQLQSASITGDVEFEDLSSSKTFDITGNFFGTDGTFHKLHVIGSLRLTNTTVDHLEATGPVSLKNSSVLGNTIIIGGLKTSNCKLGHVDVNSNLIIFHDSKVGSIRVRKTGALEQTLTLNNSSAKDIIFESGNGKVIVVGNAEITGKLVGAVLVQED